MPDWKDEIGQGGIWIKEGRKGKFLSWKITFAYNGHQVDVSGVAYKNETQEGKQPKYRMKVFDACPSRAQEKKELKPKVEEDIPF